MNSRISKLQVPPFTLIGATTLLGKLPTPLEQRFGIVFHLQTYTIDEISDILKFAGKKMQVDLDDEEIRTIAKNCKGIPRNAVRTISRVKDFRTVNPNITIEQILNKLQIIEDGVDMDDLRYMKSIYDVNRPLGLKTISQVIGVDLFTLETYTEPFLISNKYIEKTSQGRILTTRGTEFVKKYKSEIN
jgi:Holliday junction DNA helicase RuvB